MLLGETVREHLCKPAQYLCTFISSILKLLKITAAIKSPTNADVSVCCAVHETANEEQWRQARRYNVSRDEAVEEVHRATLQSDAVGAGPSQP